ncbi:MAG: helix-turn-helix transcriptional regulator [Patescibacteria group bacterium]
MKTFVQFKKESLKKPGVRKAMKELDIEFSLISEILEQRVKRGLTQKELARKIGVAQSAIARFESGSYNPTLSFLNKISHALGVKIHISS